MREKKKGLKAYDDTPPDISAEERFYNRSVHIRRDTIDFLDKNVGRGWRDMTEMSSDCGNWPEHKRPKGFPFSNMTAYRWLRQFTAPSFAFGLQDDENGNMEIFRRRRLRASDFRRWGIPVPRRFERKK